MKVETGERIILVQWYPGLIVSESSEKIVPDMDIKHVNHSCESYQFFTEPIATIDGVEMIGKRTAATKMIYPGGEFYTLEKGDGIISPGEDTNR